MASFVKHFRQLHSQKNAQTHAQSHTQDLKLKIKLLEQQIQSLQKIKSHHARSTHKPPKSNRPSLIQPSSMQQQSISPLNLTNLKSHKVTSLVTQIHTNSSARSHQKLQPEPSAPSQRQTISSIKQSLQNADLQSARKKKKSGVNIYELKGLKHNVDSNIFNVTIAQIMTEEHETYQMVKEIKRLKDRLTHLQQNKIQQTKLKLQQEDELELQYQRPFARTQQRTRIVSNIDLAFQTATARKSDTPAAGRIYSRSRVLMSRDSQDQDESSLNNSRATDELVSTHRHSIQLRRNSNPLTWNPQVQLASNQKPGEIRTHRTINHRVSNSIDTSKLSAELHLENNPTSRKRPFFHLGKKKQTVKQIGRDDSVQLPKQQTAEPAKEQDLINNEANNKKPMQLVSSLKIANMKQPQSIPTSFLPNFRQSIHQKLLPTTFPPQPSQHETQSQLQSLGRILFSLFDIYVDSFTTVPNSEYKVTKYKNCVLYRLNDESNIVWYYDGRFYFGGWEVNLVGEGKKEGFGLEIVPGQFTYQGFFVNNKRQAYGIMVNHYRAEEQKNVIYEGYWKQGLKHGRGYQAEAQLQYLGDFEAGLQTGSCKIKTDATFYQGPIKASVKQGKGHEILKNGDQYCGQFKENMFHGMGEYRWKSGAYFYGSFVKGMRKGEGVWLSNLSSEGCDIYKGAYESNKKNGFGVYQWANGTMYEGYFKNDLRHDQGLMRYPNGKTAKFMWRDGDKASKLYSKEEEEYRCKRKAKDAGETQNENEEGDGQQEDAQVENVFRNSVLDGLKHNGELKLFV